MEKNILKRTFDKATENPAFVLSMGFLILISLGGLILSTPYVSQSGKSTGLIDSFFVAASASCVTGLTPLNTGLYWNSLGHLVIIILIFLMQHRNIQYRNIALYAIVFFDLITVIYLICGIINV